MRDLPRMSELMISEMAAAWVADEIFSDRHVKPHREELIQAVFPALAELMRDQKMDRMIRDQCGLVFELIDMRVKNRSIRTNERGVPAHDYPCFVTCKLMHKDQIPALQAAITIARKMRRKPILVASN